MKIVLNQGTGQNIVIFGDYELIRIDDERTLIRHKSGEAMGTDSKNIEALIDDFYRENF